MEDNNLKNQFSADLLGAVSKVLGEAEQIDELKASTVRSYRGKASADKENAEDERDFYKAHDDKKGVESATKRINKRADGINMANDKLNGGNRFPVKIRSVGEEAEQIDELKASTVRSLLDKRKNAMGPETKEKKEKHRKSGWMAFAKLHKQPHAKVHATEEVEPIDELSKDFLRTKYIPAARKDMEKQSELGDIKSRIAYNLDNPEVRKNMHKTADSHFKKSKNRMSGIETAKDRLKNSFYDKPSDRKKQSVKEEVSLDEKHGGADYAIYHKSYTDAVDHALSHHGKSGLSVSDDDRFHHIGLMSKKPSEGNTTTLNLPAKDHATGKDHTIHMQVYNRGGSHPYELNTYSSKNSTQRQIDRVAAKRKKALGEDTIEEKLIGGQAKLDVDKDGKIEKSDFKKLRNKKIAAKMKDKDCACDDDDKMDEAVYNGHRPTGLPPGQGLPKAQQDALTAKLREYDAKMDASRKKMATKEETGLDEGRGRPPKPGSAAYIAQQKAKEAGEAEGPEPDEHIMNQVRKAADSGMMPHKIKYADGSTHSLHRVHARAVIAKYNRLKPFAKEEMQAEIAKSHEHMMKHVKD